MKKTRFAYYVGAQFSCSCHCSFNFCIPDTIVEEMGEQYIIDAFKSDDGAFSAVQRLLEATNRCMGGKPPIAMTYIFCDGDRTLKTIEYDESRCNLFNEMTKAKYNKPLADKLLAILENEAEKRGIDI